MARLKPMDVEKDSTQLSVFAREFKIDTYLSADIPLQRLSRDVARTIASHIDARGGDSSWLRRPDSEIVLNPAVGQNWDQHRTLRQLGAKNGIAVQLSTELANPRYPALVESQADATAEIRNNKFRPWDDTSGRELSIWMLPVIIGIVEVLLAIATMRTSAGQMRLIAGVFSGIITMLAITGTIAVSRNHRGNGIAGSLAACVYLTLPVTAWEAVPVGQYPALGVIAAGGVTMAVAYVFLELGFTPRPVHAAGLVVGVSVTLGVGGVALYALWRPAHVDAYAATVALVALVFGCYGQVLLSKTLARIVDPRLPDTGPDGIDVTSTDDLMELSKTTMSQQARDAIVHQRDRIIEARFIGLGLIGGAGVTVTVAATIGGVYCRFDDTVRFIVFTTPAAWIATCTFGVIAAAFCLTCTWYRDRLQRMVGTICAAVAWCGYLTGMVLTARVYDMGLIGISVGVMLGAVAWPTFRTWSAGEGLSHTAKGRLQSLEKFLYALPLPLIATLLNLAFNIRHL